MFEPAALLGIRKENATILQHKVGSRRDDTLFFDLETSTARLPSSRVTITYVSTPGSSSSVLGSRAGGSGALTPTWLDERGTRVESSNLPPKSRRLTIGNEQSVRLLLPTAKGRPIYCSSQASQDTCANNRARQRRQIMDVQA